MRRCAYESTLPAVSARVPSTMLRRRWTGIWNPSNASLPINHDPPLLRLLLLLFHNHHREFILWKDIASLSLCCREDVHNATQCLCTRPLQGDESVRRSFSIPNHHSFWKCGVARREDTYESVKSAIWTRFVNAIYDSYLLPSLVWVFRLTVDYTPPGGKVHSPSLSCMQ